ncbi:AIP3-domain-containing protein [Guyanagaster necrorhizus]|uniref:AIP3-domain-containing protein n=1 Tax=Guyanagaster necrorhizus TaxID=856835 RepID=A0A9P8AT42_9AGAR|nr:AIP3-domain-containing protein [Guyanagaster necrorhizus MCA 3950]KAG7446586.1 AIP3-domain-containing protein [Guyanagaster necrorhizus MCA 3950]
MSLSRFSPSNHVDRGHISRRNIHFSSSGNERSANEPSGSPRATTLGVESSVMRLFASTKKLLVALTQWSLMKVNEDYVSDVYVRVGNDFHAAIAAFSQFNVDMSEFNSFPVDLRKVLEQCLAEDPTPENLEVYLPTVKKITNLLSGLHAKQSACRRQLSDQRRGSQHDSRNDSRSPRQQNSHLSPLSRNTAEDGQSRGAPPSSRRNTEKTPRGPLSPVGEVSFESLSYPEQTSNMDHKSSSRRPPVPSKPSPITGSSLSKTSSQRTSTTETRRHAYVCLPRPPSPDVIVESPSPESQEESSNNSPLSSTDTATPDVVDSLVALNKSDILERRASKRYSSYNISKMIDSTREKFMGKTRSMLVSPALTPRELAALVDLEDDRTSPPSSAPSMGRGSVLSSLSPSLGALLQSPGRPISPSTTRKPTHTPSRTPEPPERPPSPKKPSASVLGRGCPPVSSKMTVFLQVDKEVKKTVIESGLSLPSIRMLFVDRFSYNPAADNFPAIYIRDPSSGVRYQLENVNEIQEKCLLSLNIEPLDQVKQHMDTQISTLSEDMKELKSAVNRISTQSLIYSPIAESAPSTPPPVSARLSRFTGSNFFPATPPQTPSTTSQSLKLQLTSAECPPRTMAELRTQFDEVQCLRRDLGVMRQLYTDFMKQTKDSLNTLRTQTQTVKQLANADIGGDRAIVDAGKKTLDTRSQNILTEVERLQDAIDAVKADVLKRHITPKPQYMKSIRKDADAAASELENLKEHLATIKPMWKKTWREELQNIVEEQEFLNHNEELLSDLLEDHKALGEVLGHLEQVVTMGSHRGRGRLPAVRTEGKGDLGTVLQQIRGAAVDPEKRLKAIEESQKNREKEMAKNRPDDDLQTKLTEFVGGKKLKLTGGVEEVERLRQKRSDQALKTMFNGARAGMNSP